MDQQKNPESSSDDRWLDEIINEESLAQQTEPDDGTPYSDELFQDTENELDQLLADIKAEDWGDDTQVLSPVTEPEEQALPQGDATTVMPALYGSNALWEEDSQPVPTEEEFRDSEFQEVFGEGQELEAAFAPPTAMENFSSGNEEPRVPAPEEESTPPQQNKTKKTVPPKRRPKHKKGYGFFGIPHIIATFVWIGLAVMIGTTLGNVLWLMGSDVLAFQQVPKTVTITIAEEDTIDDIAAQLKEEELIRYPWLFKLFAEFTGKAEKIAPGTYVLNKPDEKTGEIPGIAYDYNALCNAMRYYGPSREIVDNLLIPEGYTCAQIFELLEREGVCTVAELEEAAANGEVKNYWFLEGLERGSKYCLEGYLFPDTYDFYKDDDPVRVLNKMLAAFDNRFTEKMHESLTEINEIYASRLRKAGYSEEYIAEHPIGIHEVVTIASMIEKESAGSDENYIISSVIYNRLVSKDFPYLQIDATVVYAHGGNIDKVTYEHMQIDDPHNTYMYPGLPIGPIANPGRDALYAAMSPSDTEVDYYYYALNPETYKHEFFGSYREFENFLASIGHYDE